VFKRLFWLATGVGFGFGVSFWITRVMRQKVAQFSPDNVSAGVAKAVTGLGRDLRAAVSEGASAMRDREEQLRREISPPPTR
jgi:hypothetical protein